MSLLAETSVGWERVVRRLRAPVCIGWRRSMRFVLFEVFQDRRERLDAGEAVEGGDQLDVGDALGGETPKGGGDFGR